MIDRAARRPTRRARRPDGQHPAVDRRLPQRHRPHRRGHDRSRAGSGLRPRHAGSKDGPTDLPTYVHAYGEYAARRSAPPPSISIGLRERSARASWRRSTDSRPPPRWRGRDNSCTALRSWLAARRLRLRPQISPTRYARNDARLCTPSRRRRTTRQTIGEVQLRGRRRVHRGLRLDDGGELSRRPVRRLQRTGRAADVAPRWRAISRSGAAGSLATASSLPRAMPLRRSAAARPGDRRRRRAGAGSPLRRCAVLTRPRLYSSAHCATSKAERALRVPRRAARSADRLRQGRWPSRGVGNCVAIGDAAVAVEPLEWTNLHLAHSAIDRLVSMMPGPRLRAGRAWDYNRQTRRRGRPGARFPRPPLCRVAARPSRSGALPPRSSRRPRSPTPSACFASAGRLPYYEEETFSRDSWLAVLLGQGVLPRRTDPLIDAVAPGRRRRRRWRGCAARSRRSVPTLPTPRPSIFRTS